MTPCRTPDDVVTRVTQAPDANAAYRVLARIRSRALLEQTADLLHIDPAGLGAEGLRDAITREARA